MGTASQIPDTKTMKSFILAAVSLAIMALCSSASAASVFEGTGKDRQELGELGEFCTSCSDDSTGCDSDEYCVHLNNMMQPGCCRAQEKRSGLLLRHLQHRLPQRHRFLGLRHHVRG